MAITESTSLLISWSKTVPPSMAAACFLIYQLGLVIKVWQARHAANPETALVPTHTEPGAKGRWLQAAKGWERRFWIYALLTRKPDAKSFAGSNHFGTGEQGGNASCWRGWAFINLIPLPVIHLILHHRHPAVADITTMASLAGSLWLWAEYRAASIRPVSVDDKYLYLRYGLLTDRRIDRAQILDVKPAGFRDGHGHIRRYAGLGAPNVLITLLDGEVMAVGVDHPQRLIVELQAGS